MSKIVPADINTTDKPVNLEFEHGFAVQAAINTGHAVADSVRAAATSASKKAHHVKEVIVEDAIFVKEKIAEEYVAVKDYIVPQHVEQKTDDDAVNAAKERLANELKDDLEAGVIDHLLMCDED